ncbi:hypothetical protein BOH78_2765 [Pichia kudriavzevii]|uniref:Uncharacterized protein n=1 Tax=Pichia kudriavzevii TaxID=4909 RepID=A0A1V2LLP8_PICKU|nr:hypothetical protein BOH78_2765 [Pichia kudriavzevii]
MAIQQPNFHLLIRYPQLHQRIIHIHGLSLLKIQQVTIYQRI